MGQITAVCLFLSALLLPLAANADRVMSPEPVSISSENKEFTVEIVPAKHWGNYNATATVQSEQRYKTAKKEFELVNDVSPVYAFISNDGILVTVDEWYHRGYKHVVVIYDQNGKLIKDYELEDILNGTEIIKYVRQSVSNRWWLLGEEQPNFQFSKDNRTFIIKTEWGKVLSFDLKTGEVERIDNNF